LWSWNNKLDKAQLLRQIDYFQEMGMGGFHVSRMISYDSHETNYPPRFMSELASTPNIWVPNSWIWSEPAWIMQIARVCLLVYMTRIDSLQVRLEAANPRFTLKPDMYVDLEFAVRAPTGLVVPKEAVIDSGLRKIVYVDKGNGYFEPRTVRTGWRMGDRVQIVEGLQAGEHIVVSGNFLVDSESRMASGRGHE